MEDVKGKKLEAMKVFSATIGYLRNHLLSTFKTQQTDIEDSDIRWVLTVPAIWTDPSKQFMREAAEKVSYVFTFIKEIKLLCSLLYHIDNNLSCCQCRIIFVLGNKRSGRTARMIIFVPV